MNLTKRKGLTWSSLFRHLLAFLIACCCTGLFIIAVPATLGVINDPATLGSANLVGFVLSMGLFMGLYFIIYSGPFVLAGIGAGLWLGRFEWWFAALWGSGSALATIHLFHAPDQRLDLRFYLAVAFAGLLAGFIYWRIGVRRAGKKS